jgi:hypothetical protein
VGAGDTRVRPAKELGPEESIDASWLLRRTAPLKERVRYSVTG